MDDHYCATVVNCQTPNEIWKTLLCFRQSSTANNKYMLRKSLANHQYREDQLLAEYLAGINLTVAMLKTAGITVEDEEVVMKIINSNKEC
jgi:hypothetical protein